MPCGGRFQGIGNNGKPFSACNAKPKKGIRPAKFTNENRASMSYSMSYFAPSMPMIFTEALISLA
jgi:hypothetical protein